MKSQRRERSTRRAGPARPRACATTCERGRRTPADPIGNARRHLTTNISDRHDTKEKDASRRPKHESIGQHRIEKFGLLGLDPEQFVTGFVDRKFPLTHSLLQNTNTLIGVVLRAVIQLGFDRLQS